MNSPMYSFIWHSNSRGESIHDLNLGITNAFAETLLLIIRIG